MPPSVRTEDGKRVAVGVFEIRRPLRAGDVVGFADEFDPLGGEGFVCSLNIVHGKNQFRWRRRVSRRILP